MIKLHNIKGVGAIIDSNVSFTVAGCTSFLVPHPFTFFIKQLATYAKRRLLLPTRLSSDRRP